VFKTASLRFHLNSRIKSTKSTTSLSECDKQCIWYLNVLNELKFDIKKLHNCKYRLKKKKQLFTIAKKNQSINPKTKHIDIRFHYVRELVKKKKK